MVHVIDPESDDQLHACYYTLLQLEAGRDASVAGLAVVQSCMFLCNIISAGAGAARPVQLFSPQPLSHGHATAGMNAHAPPLPCCLSATVSPARERRRKKRTLCLEIEER